MTTVPRFPFRASYSTTLISGSPLCNILDADYEAKDVRAAPLERSMTVRSTRTLDSAARSSEQPRPEGSPSRLRVTSPSLHGVGRRGHVGGEVARRRADVTRERSTPGRVSKAACMRFETPVSYMPPIHTSMHRALGRPGERSRCARLHAAELAYLDGECSAAPRMLKRTHQRRGRTGDGFVKADAACACVRCSRASRANRSALVAPRWRHAPRIERLLDPGRAAGIERAQLVRIALRETLVRIERDQSVRSGSLSGAHACNGSSGLDLQFDARIARFRAAAYSSGRFVGIPRPPRRRPAPRCSHRARTKARPRKQAHPPPKLRARRKPHVGDPGDANASPTSCHSGLFTILPYRSHNAGSRAPHAMGCAGGLGAGGEQRACLTGMQKRLVQHERRQHVLQHAQILIERLRKVPIGGEGHALAQARPARMVGHLHDDRLSLRQGAFRRLERA